MPSLTSPRSKALSAASPSKANSAITLTKPISAAPAASPPQPTGFGLRLELQQEQLVELTREADTLRVAGMEALDVARLEAGLIMAGVDYHSSRTARHPSLAISPYEIGMDRLVDLDKPAFIGKRALMNEVAAGGPATRLV